MSRSNGSGRGRTGRWLGAATDTRSHGREIYEVGGVNEQTTEQNGVVIPLVYHHSSANGNIMRHPRFGSRRPHGQRGHGRGRIFHSDNQLQYQMVYSRQSSEPRTESTMEQGTDEGQYHEDTSGDNEACGVTKLAKLRYRDGTEVLFKLQTPSFGFVKRLQQGSNDRIMTELLIEVIAKACTSVHQSQLIGLLTKVQNSTFLKECVLLYLSYFVQEDTMVDPRICNSLIVILRTLAKLFPSKSITIITGLCAPLKRILTIETPQYNEANNEYQRLMEETADIRKQIQFGVVQRDQERQVEWTVEEREDYRRMSVIPTSEDIRGQGDPYLRENKIFQAYKDAHDYLDVQFRLMKEDLVRPLREGLAELLTSREDGNNRRTKSNMKVYRRVQITSVRCSEHGLVYKIQFDVSRLGHVQWEAGKRLMFGSLVCLSTDEFKTMVIATIAERKVKDLRRGVTYLYIDTEGNGKEDFKMDQIYEMIESPAYYEPYKSVLQALQRFTDNEKLPFERFLLNKRGEEKVPPPKYLTEDANYDFSSIMHTNTIAERNLLEFGYANLDDHAGGIVTVLDLNTWPTAEELGLDVSQYNALQTALTKEFAVIQGPPGTGKTFIGVKLVQLMLENNKNRRTHWSGPIMLVCFTNHALDQFLEEIIRLYPDDVAQGVFVRIGDSSKSENEELKKCFLKYIKRNRTSAACQEFRGATIEPKEKMTKLENEIMKLSAYTEIAEKDIISPEVLRPYMRHVQFKHIGHFLQWLCDRKAEPGTPNLLAADANVGSRQNQNDQRYLEEEYEVPELLEAEEREKNDNNLMSAEEKFQAIAKSIREEKFLTLYGKEDKHFRELYQTVQSIHIRFHEAFQKPAVAIAVNNQWQLTLADRWRLYNYWVKRFIAAQKEHMQTLLNDHAIEKRKLEEVQDEIDYRIFSHAKIIAMTTTGAAQRSHLLKRLAPKIVIVEEAAEVLEAHVVASLSEKCEHLVLIGDHQQLKPKPADYSLAKRYRLDISLFEKVVLNKLHCDRLTIQHRMRPEIAELLVPHIYKSLENHESVLSYDNVANVFGNLFFVNHSESENSTDDNRSHSNDHEATFISELCRYLLNVGYEPKQITVLTYYTGQFFLMRKLMPKSEFEGVRITPVDNFQGEENDIILLSLVRSNDEGKSGFLKIPNRACVALSRAKKGLYIIGNANLLRDESPLWRDILDTLKKQNKLVDSLPLGCHKHEIVNYVKASADFLNVPRSGCDHPCDYRLPCGHVCAKRCHELDLEHQLYKCNKPCEELCANNKHRCRKLCFEDCGDCTEVVERTLSRCGHQATMPCYLKEEDFNCEQPCKLECSAGHLCQQVCYEKCKCQILVTRTLTRCHHEATMPCHLDELKYECKEPCKKVCPSNHPCKRLCFEHCGLCKVLVIKTLSACKHTMEMPCYFPEKRFKCRERCTKSCSSDHPCQKLCYESCGSCMVPVTKILSICKHEAIMPCSTNERQYRLNNKCTVEVEITLPLCRHVVQRPCHLAGRPIRCLEPCKKSCSFGHPCEKKCHESCGDCRVMVEKVLPRCEHKAMVHCYQRVDSYVCQIQCNRACTAGHSCPELCHEKCYDCNVQVEKVLPSCEHKARMPCSRDPSKHRCQLPCERKCPAGHRCPKKCGEDCGNCVLKVQKTLPNCNHINTVECHQPPSSVKCKRPCEKSLLCRHKCQDVCGAVECTAKCKAKLTKELPCKHTASIECWEDPRTHVCHRKVKKTLSCDHVATMECHQDPKDYHCRKPVERKLLCDHAATMECSQNPNTYLCRKRIEVTVCEYGHTKEVECCDKENKFPPCVEIVNVPCSTGIPNHVIRVQCRLRETADRIGCPSTCDVELDCGHRCTNTCKNCVQRGSHNKCKHKCMKRFPLCRHSCRQYCGDQCLPCLNESSYVICSHGKSNKSCTEPHRLCHKPCDWNCPHYSCTLVCSQECNRPPCNNPCRKPLGCRHVCSGLCGEPCISLCRRCNKEKFHGLAWSSFHMNESSRFLELQSCRHIVEVTAMDRCFLDTLTSLPYVLDQSRFLLCPVCSEKVIFCPRYNSYIRRHESQLNAAKQLIDESKKFRKLATEYIDKWLESHRMNPENRQKLFTRNLTQRLRLGALCLLQEIEILASLQTNKTDFHKRFILNLENAIERVKENTFYNESNKTVAASDTILMYKFYMEAQTYRLASFIRGPKLRVLDKCKEDLQAFESMEFVEDNFQRLWRVIEKLNRKLSQELSSQDRKDGIEDYIHNLNRFYDRELDATFISQWLCCTQGHVYVEKKLLEGNQIDENCPYCHPLRNYLLYFLQPDCSESPAVSKLDTTGYYQLNVLNEGASGLENRTRKKNKETNHEPERTLERSGTETSEKSTKSKVSDSNLEGRYTAETVRERGGRRGRGRNKPTRGSRMERNSEDFQGQNQISVQTVREPQASVQSSIDTHRSSKNLRGRGRGKGRGRGGLLMKHGLGIEQTSTTRDYGATASIATVHGGNFRGGKRGSNYRRGSSNAEMQTERSNSQTLTFYGSRGNPRCSGNTVDTQEENPQAVGSPTLQERQKDDLASVIGGQDDDVKRRPYRNMGDQPVQNSRGRYKRGTRGGRSSARFVGEAKELNPLASPFYPNNF